MPSPINAVIPPGGMRIDFVHGTTEFVGRHSYKCYVVKGYFAYYFLRYRNWLQDRGPLIDAQLDLFPLDAALENLEWAVSVGSARQSADQRDDA